MKIIQMIGRRALVAIAFTIAASTSLFSTAHAELNIDLDKISEITLERADGSDGTIVIYKKDSLTWAIDQGDTLKLYDFKYINDKVLVLDDLAGNDGSGKRLKFRLDEAGEGEITAERTNGKWRSWAKGKWVVFSYGTADTFSPVIPLTAN